MSNTADMMGMIKGCLVLILGFFLVSFVLGIGMMIREKVDPAYRAEMQKERAEAAAYVAKRDADRARKAQEAFPAVEEKFKSIAVGCDGPWAAVELSARGVENGMTTRLDVYQAAGSARESCESVQLAFGDLPKELPEVLPKEVRKILKESAKSKEVAVSLRRGALASLQKYLDTHSVKQLADFRSKAERALTYDQAALEMMSVARQQLGLPLAISQPQLNRPAMVFRPRTAIQP